MKLKTLLAVAVAAAFSGGALAQTGGTTQSPTVNQPQGNPPASAPAGDQKDPSSVPGARGRDSATGATTDRDMRRDARTEKDKDKMGGKNATNIEGTSSGAASGSSAGTTSPSSTNVESSTGASGAGVVTTPGVTTPAPASSPSSGGPAQTQGGMGSSTSKEPK